jgi:hypothetical protein
MIAGEGINFADDAEHPEFHEWLRFALALRQMGRHLRPLVSAVVETLETTGLSENTYLFYSSE